MMRDMAEGARTRARTMLCNGGYKGGGEIKEMKTIAKRAIGEHEISMHDGKHTKLRLKSGGAVHGDKSEHRPDRRARGGGTEEMRKDEDNKEYDGHMKAESSGEDGEIHGRKRGGGTEGKKGGKGKIGAVNIAIGNPEKEEMAKQQGMEMGVQQGAKAVLAKLQGAGAGGPPPGAGPGGPPMPPHPPMAGPPPGGMPPGAPPPGAMPPGAGGPPPPGMMPHKRGGEVKVREHSRRRAGGSV